MEEKKYISYQPVFARLCDLGETKWQLKMRKEQNREYNEKFGTKLKDKEHLTKEQNDIVTEKG